MNVYVMQPVTDNPLFGGLALLENGALLKTWPPDWRRNYQTWQPILRKDTWPTPEVIGNVRVHNDYPCINLAFPAFSQRAVDLLRDILEPSGELLPVRHEIGTYYFFNCTRISNCVDLNASKTTKIDGGIISSTERLIFKNEMLDDLIIFKERTLLMEQFCTQRFVDRVEAAGLQGFVFIPIWPLPKGVTYYDEMYRVNQLAKKWKPKQLEELDIKGNKVVLRLYCASKKASKKELAAVEEVMTLLESRLYNPNQTDPDSYFGNVEGHDVVNHEIRVFFSAPDSDRLVSFLMPQFRALPWPGKYQVVKRRGEYVDVDAPEEYVPLA